LSEGSVEVPLPTVEKGGSYLFNLQIENVGLANKLKSYIFSEGKVEENIEKEENGKQYKLSYSDDLDMLIMFVSWEDSNGYSHHDLYIDKWGNSLGNEPWSKDGFGSQGYDGEIYDSWHLEGNDFSSADYGGLEGWSGTFEQILDVEEKYNVLAKEFVEVFIEKSL